MFAAGPGATVLSRVLDHNFRTYLPFDLLVKADRMSMAHGLELRSPFLDTELIEYVSRLPASYLRRATQTKRILRSAFRDLLPAEIRRRGKMGFAVPLGSWFRGELKSFLYDHLTRHAKISEYLDEAAVQLLVDQHSSGYADHGQKLWLLLTLEVWLRSRGRDRCSGEA
jgi:asparagine synthase (glutamine-hydrolysing)